MTFFCIADSETVRGFHLAGVPGQAVATAQEAATALEQALLHPDCGVLILTENVATSLGPHLEALRRERDQPLVVEIPGPSGPVPGRKGLHQLVQQAVGFRIGKELE